MESGRKIKFWTWTGFKGNGIKSQIRVKYRKMSDIKVESLRSLDDFLLESARFQLPNGASWGRRVKGNLLYYQTNYAILAIVIILIIAAIRPSELATGIVVALVGLLAGHFATERFVAEFRIQHPWVVAGSGLVLIYLLLSVLGSVAVLLLAILLPVFVSLIHASLRLRNLKNKITNQLDKAGIKKTPMGYILDEWGFVFDDE